MVCFVIGILCICIPICRYLKIKIDISSGKYYLAEGVVVDYATSYDSDNGSIIYRPIYEFHSYDGKTYRCVSKTGSGFKFKAKKPKKIAYKPSDPVNSRVYNDYLIVIIFGLFFCLFGAIWYII